MENTALQLTIREMTQQATSPKFWAGMFAVVCILTVSAPFSTDLRFTSPQLFFYWGGIAISTYFCATFVLMMTLRKLRLLGKPETFSRVIASLASAGTVTALVIFINTVVIGDHDFDWEAYVFLGVSCILISLAVDIIFFVAHDTLEDAKASSSTVDVASDAILNETPKAASAFYQRLPKSLGTDVISLQAQDHYVDVKTTLGSELILIRLSDAIQELGEDHGVQTHRSWWVMTKHVVDQKRVEGKPHLLLSDGSLVPISRTYSANVKTALAKI